MADIDIYNIPVAGTQEHTDAQNAQLLKDLDIYATRPFLNKMEKHDLGDYYSTWGINRIIALFNFDTEGKYLPQVYQAPIEYLKMLYPIDDIMNYNRQGTLVIDREQYSPELRKLSFFIYMVDQELYDQYSEGQNFRGATKPTFMFNKRENNGVRIFRDYYALARHLRKQRFITYCLGPRTAFYLRYFIYEMHVHTVDCKYAYGKHTDPTITNAVIESIKRHLCFNSKEQLEYKLDFTVDKYHEYREMMKQYKIDLPPIQEFHSRTDIIRFKKQRLGHGKVYHLKGNKVSKYANAGIYPYNHMRLIDGKAVFYIWDTRVITKIVPQEEVEITDFTDNTADNGFDLVCKANADKDIREACESLRFKAAIQMRDPVTGINC